MYKYNKARKSRKSRKSRKYGGNPPTPPPLPPTPFTKANEHTLEVNRKFLERLATVEEGMQKEDKLIQADEQTMSKRRTHGVKKFRPKSGTFKRLLKSRGGKKHRKTRKSRR